MLFNSLAFLAFFPLVCIIYYALPSLKMRNYFLLLASYYFYMNWEPVYSLLLLSSTAITFFAALMVEKSPKHKRLWLSVSIILNLLILFFFKYYNFAAENVVNLMEFFGIKIHCSFYWTFTSNFILAIFSFIKITICCLSRINYSFDWNRL